MFGHRYHPLGQNPYPGGFMSHKEESRTRRHVVPSEQRSFFWNRRFRKASFCRLWKIQGKQEEEFGPEQEDRDTAGGGFREPYFSRDREEAGS